MITVLTGGTGGAKLVWGLAQIVPQKEITCVVNTGDDMRWWGLHISPDLDSVTYVLAGLLSRERVPWAPKTGSSLGTAISPRTCGEHNCSPKDEH